MKSWLFVIGLALGITSSALYRTIVSQEDELLFGSSCEGDGYEHDDAGNSGTRELVTGILSENLHERRFYFADVVRAAYGQEVIGYDRQQEAHRVLVEAIEAGVQVAINRLSQSDSPVRNLRRVNEASRYFEDFLMEELEAHPALSCAIPKTTEKKEQRSGYPDLRIVHTETNTVAYLDPKLFEDKSISSSLRTFYFEPRVKTSKVNDDALHFLLGISHDGRDGEWTFNGWHLIDLSQFEVRLKAEFQGSNRDLYREPLIIKTSEAAEN